jgi:osmotically-inducible protein OsmY
VELRVLSFFRVVFLPWIAGLVLFALQGCATSPEGIPDRRAGAQADDQVIETRAAAHLRDEIGNGNRLSATSYNRHVLLTGEAPDASVRSRIAETIMGIENVQGVWNEIVIADSNSVAAPIDDSFIASSVKAHLDQASPLVANHVKVVVDAGTVFLLGIVNAQEAQEVIQIARTVDGVRYVVNVMQIVSDAEIQRIEGASILPPPPVAADCDCAAPALRETW